MYRLREIERDDIPHINSWRSSRELIYHLGAPFRYINSEVDMKWFDNYMQNRSNTIRCSILDEEDHIVGLVSLTNIDHLNQSAVFHIMVGEKIMRNKGIGSFAAMEILKHAFHDMNLNRIELSVLDGNERAIALYKKLGFKEEGIKRKAVYKSGYFTDMLIMSILKSEFKYEEML